MFKFKNWVYSRCEKIYIKKAREARIDHSDAFQLIEALMRHYEQKPIIEQVDLESSFLTYFENKVDKIIESKTKHKHLVKRLSLEYPELYDITYKKNLLLFINEVNEVFLTKTKKETLEEFPFLESLLL